MNVSETVNSAIEIITNSPPIPTPLTNPMPTEQDIALVNKAYLMHLCKQTGRRYEGLPLEKFEGLTSVSEINRVFFGLEEEKINVKVNPSQISAMKNMTIATTTVQTLERRVTDARAHYEHVSVALGEAQALYITEMRKLEEFKSVPRTTVYEAVTKQLEGGKWELVQCSAVDNYVIFGQVHDTIVHWVDKAKGIDMSVNLGRYAVKINLGTSAVSITTHKNNIKAHGFPHPHVKANGAVCWGNAKDHVTRAMQMGNLGDVLDICDLLLKEYNDTSPYTSLKNFYDERKRTEFMSAFVQRLGVYVPAHKVEGWMVGFRKNRYVSNATGEYVTYKFDLYLKDGVYNVLDTSNNTPIATPLKDEDVFDTFGEAE